MVHLTIQKVCYKMTYILLEDDVGGLEVEDPHRPGTFVVNQTFFYDQFFQFLTVTKACSSHARFHHRKCRRFPDDVFVSISFIIPISLRFFLIHSVE